MPPALSHAPVLHQQFRLDPTGGPIGSATIKPNSTILPPIVASVNFATTSEQQQIAAHLRQEFISVRPAPEIIFPKAAALILERFNKLNRRKREIGIKHLVGAINRENFGLSDSCICFSQDGELLNGQNRLEACVRSDKPIIVQVMVQMPRICIDFMDLNNRRDTFDMLAVNGFEQASKIFGSTVLALYAPHHNATDRPRLDAAQLRDFITLHSEALQFSMAEFASTQWTGEYRAVVRAAVTRATYHIDDLPRLSEFVQTLLGRREPVVGDDDYALSLRKFLRTFTASNLAGRQEIHRKTEKAILMFMDHKSGRDHLYAASSELYPLDSEKK